MVNFLKAVTAGIIAYLGIFVALVIAPFLFLLFAWTGICMFLAVAFFFFWLVIHHDLNALRAAGYMLLWGSPPAIASAVLGFYQEQWKARRRMRQATPQLDAPFTISLNRPSRGT